MNKGDSLEVSFSPHLLPARSFSSSPRSSSSVAPAQPEPPSERCILSSSCLSPPPSPVYEPPSLWPHAPFASPLSSSPALIEEFKKKKNHHLCNINFSLLPVCSARKILLVFERHMRGNSGGNVICRLTQTAGLIRALAALSWMLKLHCLL